MSTAAVSSNSIYQELQAYFHQRTSDLTQLGNALQSGDLGAAQQEYAAIQNLGKKGPFPSGDPFLVAQREKDFEAIGTALQAGDLAGARQAFEQLKSTFDRHAEPPPVADSNPSPSTTTPPAANSPSSTTGPEIVLNLGNVPAGEQITIGLSNTAGGAEQVTISAADSQGHSAGQIKLNLAQNSNEQIVLNLFNGTAAASAQGSQVSVTA